MPDYPISYFVTFAVNGVMVIVVFISLAKPQIARHSIKINLSLFISGFLTLILPLVTYYCKTQALAFWLSVLVMFFIGVTMALALAQTLSYMSLMPERYMALNSMGIGVSGLASLLLNILLLVCFGDSDSQEFTRIMTFFSIGFLMMTGIASMYFVESKSQYSQYYINLASLEPFTEI